MSEPMSIPCVSVKYAHDGSSTRSNALGMQPMQERVWQKRGEQYLLIKSPPASGKSRALMFVALDKLHHQKLRQAIIVVPEKTIGANFHDQPLSQFGCWADWKVEPKWNLCDAPGPDNGGKVEAVKKFLGSATPGNAGVLAGSSGSSGSAGVLAGSSCSSTTADGDVGVPIAGGDAGARVLLCTHARKPSASTPSRP